MVWLHALQSRHTTTSGNAISSHDLSINMLINRANPLIVMTVSSPSQASRHCSRPNASQFSKKQSMKFQQIRANIIVELTPVSARQRLISNHLDADALRMKLQLVHTFFNLSSNTDPITTQKHHAASRWRRRGGRSSRARSSSSSRIEKWWLFFLLFFLPRRFHTRGTRGVPRYYNVLAIIYIDKWCDALRSEIGLANISTVSTEATTPLSK